MPVPSVVTMTSPSRPRAAPYRTSASPAASASLTTCTSRPVASVNSASASVPIQDSSMLAAECTTPCRTTPGTVTPTGPVESGNRPSRSTKTAATASGVDGCGRRDPLALGGEVARREVHRSALDARCRRSRCRRAGPCRPRSRTVSSAACSCPSTPSVRVNLGVVALGPPDRAPGLPRRAGRPRVAARLHGQLAWSTR